MNVCETIQFDSFVNVKDFLRITRPIVMLDIFEISL
jgi:hypothetical protein